MPTPKYIQLHHGGAYHDAEGLAREAAAREHYNATYPGPRDVRRFRHPEQAGIQLGYVDDAGVYRFPDGRSLPTSGGVDLPDGRHFDGTCRLVVSEDGTVCHPPAVDPQDFGTDRDLRRHAVDGRLQAQHDADRG